MKFLDRLFGRGGRRVNPQSLPIEGKAPEFRGITGWINGAPLTMAGLAGKVVLVDFWTYSCVNCVRTLPHLRSWHETYAAKGLAIVGVHTPEFDFEKARPNVEAAVERFGIPYPVALDNDYAMWNAYRNHYWPAHYFIDAKGDIRYHHFGEGGYEHSEEVIRALLAEAGSMPPDSGRAAEAEDGIDFKKIGTPETYLGFDRLEYLGSPEAVRSNAPQRYSSVPQPALNIFYLEGQWEIRNDCAVPLEAGARIVYRVRCAKVHLVMEGPADGARLSVAIDGRPLAEQALGADVGGDSIVTVREGRMYDLVDLRGDYGTHLLELSFLDPGVKVYAFTFG